jgi:hypothetical protein
VLVATVPTLRPVLIVMVLMSCCCASPLDVRLAVNGRGADATNVRTHAFSLRLRFSRRGLGLVSVRAAAVDVPVVAPPPDDRQFDYRRRMSISLGHITFDSANPPTLARFWADALGRPLDDGASEFFASIDDGAVDRPSWFFIRVPETKTTKNRLHVDLTADDRESEVTRLSALGAGKVSDHDEWGAVWTVMTDPEANEFCVGQRPLQQ